MALYQTPKLVKVKAPELVKIKLTLTPISLLLDTGELAPTKSSAYVKSNCEIKNNTT